MRTVKTTVYFYWTNALQPEEGPRMYPNNDKWDEPPEGWVLVSEQDCYVVVPDIEQVAGFAIETIQKKIDELRAECEAKVQVLQNQQHKFEALTI